MRHCVTAARRLPPMNQSTCGQRNDGAGRGVKQQSGSDEGNRGGSEGGEHCRGHHPGLGSALQCICEQPEDPCNIR